MTPIHLPWPLVSVLLLASCSSHPGGIEYARPTEGPLSADIARMAQCTADRNHLACTQDYQPVCGIRQLSSHLRSESSLMRETYPNACTACSDETVIGHMPGEC